MCGTCADGRGYDCDSSNTEKPSTFAVVFKRNRRRQYRESTFTPETFGRSLVMSGPIKVDIEQLSVQPDAVACEPSESKVVKTQEEQRTGMVLNQETLSNHGEKEFSKPLISANLPYREKCEAYKPVTLQLCEQGENNELPSLSSVNQNQACSTGKKSSIGADKYQSPNKKCSKSTLCSVFVAGDQAQLVSSSPSNVGEPLIDGQEKKQAYLDTHIFDSMGEVKQKDFLSEKNLRELDQSFRNSWSGNSPKRVSSPISNLSKYSSRKDQFPSALSEVSNVRSKVHSINAIFDTPIVNEISVHGYLSPEKGIIASDTYYTSDGSVVPGDTSKVDDIPVDHVYLKPQTVSQGVDFLQKPAEKKSKHAEKFRTPFAIREREASFSSVDTIGIPLNDIFTMDDNIVPKNDKPVEESSWFSPIYGIFSQII